MQNCRHGKVHWSEITTTTKKIKTTEAADENMKHKARKQKTAVETIEAHKIKVVSARKEEKDTVSWKHEPPSPSLWNNPRPGPLLITRDTALCLPVHFWHRGTPAHAGAECLSIAEQKGFGAIYCQARLTAVPAERGRQTPSGGWSCRVLMAFVNLRESRSN